MPIWSYIIIAIVGYLLGSIPTGYLVAMIKGIDIRTVGSGNIGATNAFRVLGKPAGIFVLLVDAVKGFGACVFAFYFLLITSQLDGIYVEGETQWMRAEPYMLVAGIFAVLGHNYTCWLKFKGGKGIATTAGVYLALAPLALGIAFVVFVLALVLTRYVSVGSILAAIALPTAVWVQQPHNYFLGIVTTALGVLAIYKHRSNIKRLMNGTENRLGKKPAEAPK